MSSGGEDDRMHIVMIPSWYPQDEADFNGSFFAEQAEALVAEGHRVGVLAVRGVPAYRAGAVARARRASRASVEQGVAVVRRDLVVPFPLVHAVNQRVWDRAWAGLLKSYIAEHGRPDVLHAHAMFPGGIAAHRLSRDFGIPFVVTEHRPSSIARLAEPGMRSLAVGAARAAGARIAVARGFVPRLDEAYGLSGTTGWEYLPGLLSPQFEHIAPRPVPEGPFLVGHVSHLDPGKRVSLLIGAFADAFPHGGERLRIAGDSVHRAALEQVAADEGVADRVDFAGAVPRTGIAAEFARYHVFALPSEAEAFGTVLWEAMASGVPVVSTETWAGWNSVQDDNGLLVPIDDRGGLASALLRMRDGISAYDPARVREIALEHCGQQVFVSNYIAAYRKAIDT